MASGGGEKPLVLVQSFIQQDPDHGLPADRQEALREHFHVITLSDLDTHPEYFPRVQGIGLVEPPAVRQRFLHLMPKLTGLKIISVNGVGYDSYYSHFAPLGVPIANTPNAVTASTADHGMALLLATATDLVYGIQIAMREDPPRLVERTRRVPGVNGLTLGIVGMGRIGYAVARRAHAFDMEIVYHNRSRRTREEEKHVGARYCPILADMLPRCDYVILTCPRTPDTEHFFGAEQFRLMKQSASLINLSRGEIVHQEALVEALSSGVIRKAALDVTYPEPLPAGHPLLTLPNVIITAHMGGMQEHSARAVVEDNIRNLKAALIDNKPIPFLIQPKP